MCLLLDPCKCLAFLTNADYYLETVGLMISKFLANYIF